MYDDLLEFKSIPENLILNKNVEEEFVVKEKQIEPSGWEDPDFKQAKKIDDGTNIWGDPESKRLIKVQKWSFSPKAAVTNTNLNTNNANTNTNTNGQGEQSLFKDVTNVTNQESSWEKLNINEWSQHLTDSKSSWQTNGKEINPLPVKDHDWDKGRIDTTNWVLNSQIDDLNDFKNKPTLNNRNAGILNQSASSNSLLNQARLNNNNLNLNLNSNNNQNQTNLNNQSKMILNLQQPQQQQTPTPPSQSISMGANNNLIIQNTPNTTNNGGGGGVQNQLIESFQMAVQANLISADLLNTKLPPEVLSLLNQLFQTLNNFTNSCTRINNLQNKRRAQLSSPISNTISNTISSTMSSTISNAQFKCELDMLNQENQAYKENLFILQKKINTAHMLLKQQSSLSSLSSSPTNFNSNLNDTDLSILKDQSINNLNNNNNNNNKLFQFLQDQQQQQQQKKLQNNRQSSQISKQSNQNQSTNFFTSNFNQSSIQSQWSNFNNSNSFNFDHHNPQSIHINNQNVQLDDRITPFVPGKLWAGQGQHSIEDDPNCTPGSFAKPLLTETIDPESILASLQRSNWNTNINSNNSFNIDFTTANANRLNKSLNNTNSQSWNNGQWSQNNNINSNNHNGAIGEQLWQTTTTNRNNITNRIPNHQRNTNNTTNNNNNINNSNYSFNQTNPLNTINQQQQQFMRSNSWSLNPQQQQQQFNPFNNQSVQVNNSTSVFFK